MKEGLVWSENIENQNERLYSEMNASFKFSTYLAAGITIIVNKGLAKENFVTKYKLGYVAPDLNSAVEYVQNLSREEYDNLFDNVNQIGSLIKEGFFTRKLLIKVQEALFLQKKRETNDNL